MGSDRPPRILVVDNNKAVCAVTAKMLESLGRHVEAETDGLRALKVFRFL
jgi:CheY-like chemotaxis protein